MDRRLRKSRRLLLVLALLIALLTTIQVAIAHPLGNFTISHYSELTFTEDRVTIHYALDFAEIPSFQQRERFDPNGDGLISAGESRNYVASELPALIDNLTLIVAGERIALTIERATVSFRDGEGELATTLIDAQLVGVLPQGWDERGIGSYSDTNFESRSGWREIVVRSGPGISLTTPDALTTSITSGLGSYPDDQLSSPLDMRSISFELAPGDGISSSAMEAERTTQVAESTIRSTGATDRLAERLAASELTPGLIAILLLLAAGWGALHALSPGHGKAVVAAYLIGTRGTARHAGLLGLTVTLTHTAGVFLLAIITLSLSRFILPEDLYPWLGIGSGLLVVAIGGTLLYGRMKAIFTGGHRGPLVHDHSDPNHSHAPPAQVTTRGLLAMGISGGLVPCPSALILLLSAITLDRLELGIVLVVAFSLGLAAVLVAIGLLVVYARWVFRRFSFELRIPSFVPAVSAAAISIAGVVIVYQSLFGSGIV